MCIISEKIKFCTCVDEVLNLTQLNNYWILYRYNSESAIEKGFDQMEVGKFIEPASDSIFKINEDTILKRIYESDAFDFPLKFKNKDTLVIHLNNNSENGLEKISYQFRYERKKWESQCFGSAFANDNDVPYEIVSIDFTKRIHWLSKLGEFKSGCFKHIYDRNN